METSVQSNLVLEVLTNLVTPVDADFPTPAVHLTKVGGSRLCTNGGRYVLSEVQQHLTVALLIVVNVDGKTTVQQLEVKTDIGLIRLIPVYVTVDGRGVFVDRDTSVLTWVLVGRLTEYDTLVLIKCVDLQPLPWCQVITTGDTPAGTDLQEVNPLQPFYILEPRLLADNPTCGDSREGSPVVLRCELSRGIGTEQELEQVTVCISVVDTSDIGQRTALSTVEVQ